MHIVSVCFSPLSDVNGSMSEDVSRFIWIPSFSSEG